MGKNGCSFSIIWVYMYLQENLLKYFLGNQVEGHEEIAWNLQHACFHCLWKVLQSEKKGNTISKVQTITIIYLLIITLQHSYCKQWPSYNLWSGIIFFSWQKGGRGKKNAWYNCFTTHLPPLHCLPVNRSVILYHAKDMSYADFTRNSCGQLKARRQESVMYLFTFQARVSTSWNVS